MFLFRWFKKKNSDSVKTHNVKQVKTNVEESKANMVYDNDFAKEKPLDKIVIGEETGQAQDIIGDKELQSSDSNTEDIIKEKKSCNGCSVTKRIENIQQPQDGYLNPRDMIQKKLGDGIETLIENEAIRPQIIGLAVDYLTRFMSGASLKEAFKISIMGAIRVNEQERAMQLLAGITGLNKQSVFNAVKLCGFDVCYRTGRNYYKPIDEIIPDDASIENIIVMVRRALNFFESYGPVVLDGFTFKGGYTDIVCAGDGDFITKDTLWEFKVLKFDINKKHTLQLLMYWRMGLHSIHPEFQNIRYLGIYNPRKNIVYRIAVADIPDEVIKEVETEVIGYKE